MKLKEYCEDANYKYENIPNCCCCWKKRALLCRRYCNALASGFNGGHVAPKNGIGLIKIGYLIDRDQYRKVIIEPARVAVVAVEMWD